jgi:hypothetical protein
MTNAHQYFCNLYVHGDGSIVKIFTDDILHDMKKDKHVLDSKDANRRKLHEAQYLWSKCDRITKKQIEDRFKGWCKPVTIQKCSKKTTTEEKAMVPGMSKYVMVPSENKRKLAYPIYKLFKNGFAHDNQTLDYYEQHLHNTINSKDFMLLMAKIKMPPFDRHRQRTQKIFVNKWSRLTSSDFAYIFKGTTLTVFRIMMLRRINENFPTFKDFIQVAAHVVGCGPDTCEQFLVNNEVIYDLIKNDAYYFAWDIFCTKFRHYLK